MKHFVRALLSLLLLTTTAFAGRDYDYYVAGNQNDVATSTTAGFDIGRADFDRAPLPEAAPEATLLGVVGEGGDILANGTATLDQVIDIFARSRRTPTNSARSRRCRCY